MPYPIFTKQVLRQAQYIVFTVVKLRFEKIESLELLINRNRLLVYVLQLQKGNTMLGLYCWNNWVSINEPSIKSGKLHF